MIYGRHSYKHREADLAQVKASLAAPNFLLKIIPHVDGTPRICELVEYRLEDVVLKGAWTGPAALHLSPHTPWHPSLSCRRSRSCPRSTSLLT